MKRIEKSKPKEASYRDVTVVNQLGEDDVQRVPLDQLLRWIESNKKRGLLLDKDLGDYFHSVCYLLLRGKVAPFQQVRFHYSDVTKQKVTNGVENFDPSSYNPSRWVRKLHLVLQSDGYMTMCPQADMKLDEERIVNAKNVLNDLRFVRSTPLEFRNTKREDRMYSICESNVLFDVFFVYYTPENGEEIEIDVNDALGYTLYDEIHLTGREEFSQRPIFYQRLARSTFDSLRPEDSSIFRKTTVTPEDSNDKRLFKGKRKMDAMPIEQRVVYFNSLMPRFHRTLPRYKPLGYDVLSDVFTPTLRLTDEWTRSIGVSLEEDNRLVREEVERCNEKLKDITKRLKEASYDRRRSKTNPGKRAREGGDKEKEKEVVRRRKLALYPKPGDPPKFRFCFSKDGAASTSEVASEKEKKEKITEDLFKALLTMCASEKENGKEEGEEGGINKEKNESTTKEKEKEKRKCVTEEGGEKEEETPKEKDEKSAVSDAQPFVRLKRNPIRKFVPVNKVCANNIGDAPVV